MLLLFYAQQGQVPIEPPPEPVSTYNPYGGGGGARDRSPGLAKVERQDAAELEAIYDTILGIEKPAPVIRAAIKAVERVAEAKEPAPETVDWEAVAEDVKAVKALLRAYEDWLDEQDVEDAMKALLPLLEDA